MKKVLVASVVTIAFAFVTTIAFSGDTFAGQKVKSADVVTTVIQKPKECHYPDDPQCPLSASQKALLEEGHDLTIEQQQTVDQMDFSDICFDTYEHCLKKKH